MRELLTLLMPWAIFDRFFFVLFFYCFGVFLKILLEVLSMHDACLQIAQTNASKELLKPFKMKFSISE